MLCEVQLYFQKCHFLHTRATIFLMHFILPYLKIQAYSLKAWFTALAIACGVFNKINNQNESKYLILAFLYLIFLYHYAII